MNRNDTSGRRAWRRRRRRNDRDTNKRLQALLGPNAEFAEDYFSQPAAQRRNRRRARTTMRATRRRSRMSRTLLQQEEAAAQYRAGLGEQPASSRVGTEREIRELHGTRRGTETPATRITAPRWTGSAGCIAPFEPAEGGLTMATTDDKSTAAPDLQNVRPARRCRPISPSCSTRNRFKDHQAPGPHGGRRPRPTTPTARLHANAK